MVDPFQTFHDFLDILENAGLGAWLLVDAECGEYHFIDYHGADLSINVNY